MCQINSQMEKFINVELQKLSYDFEFLMMTKLRQENVKWL